MLCTMTNSMPLFSRLIASWSALLILIGACVLQIGIVQLVYSDLTVGYDIQDGNFRSSNFTSNDVAAAKLSDGQNQQGWWKLANADWHDSAIQRFFSQGPLLAADMKKLANASGQSDSWRKSGISLNQTDLMLALQQHSTATYRMNRTIQGTGRIKASMWTLLFRCIGIDSCNEGFSVPMLPVPLSSQNQQLDEFSFHSLWLNLTNNLLVNAIPSFIAKLPPPRSVTMNNVDDPQLSIVINVYDNVNDCPPTAAALLGYRSLLDASYGLVPGFACINFGTADQPFKLLVSLVLFFDNGTEPADINLTTLKDFFSQVNVKPGEWKHLPFEECSEAVLLIRSSQYPTSLKLCYNQVCVTADEGNGTCTRDGVQHLRFLHSISIFSNSCTFDGGKPLHASNSTASIQVSCQMGSTNGVCNGTVDVINTDPAYSINPLRLLSPESNWISTKGNNTSEFSYAPNMADFNATRMCTRKPSPLSPFFLSNTTQAAFLQAIQIKATAYLNSFIAEHNIAFMMVKGSATDFRSFLALILSTAISVILTIAGPFPNFLLRRICRIRPLHLDSQRSEVSKVVNVSVQMLCSMLLSFCLFLPVLYVAWSELDRESPFDTWDLGANDQFIYNSNFGSDMQLRVVYLLYAESQYESHFVSASTWVAGITCFIAGLCSAWRSKEVFDRYALLQKCGSIVTSNIGGRPVKEQLDREALHVRALKAIEMTEAEYLALKTEYAELQQMATKRRRPSYFSPAKIRGALSPLTGMRRPRGTPASAFLVGYTLSWLSLRRWKCKRVASYSHKGSA